MPGEGRNVSNVTNSVMIDCPSFYVIKMTGRYLEGRMWAAEIVNLSMYAFRYVMVSPVGE